MGSAELAFKLSRELLDAYGIYVQPINYPTVSRGQEMLRVAPTPHHTPEMMQYFVASLVKLWQDNDLELRQPSCESCRLTLKKKYWITTEEHTCDGQECHRYVKACA